MALEISGWEQPLFTKAYEALEHRAEHMLPAAGAEEQQLRAAYAFCANMTAEHSRTFHLASALLPSQQRLAVRALYAFSRVSDNLVDEEGDLPPMEWAEWRSLSLAEHPPADNPVALAWADTAFGGQPSDRDAVLLWGGFHSGPNGHAHRRLYRWTSGALCRQVGRRLAADQYP